MTVSRQRNRPGVATEGRGRGALVRATAARLVVEVVLGRSLNDVLPRHQTMVAETDRALLAELAYGVCRWYFRLEFIAGQLLSRPFKARDQVLKALILVGLYQLLFSRVPPHAAIGETAGAAAVLRRKWATGLVNAVLRRCQREAKRLQEEASRIPQARFSQPQWFVDAMQS
ncbi:MAG TPA: 16S rRNA (cytosine(967)-C(5))-methyltransferase, partial [Chromatiaceae bacterium]|nr:16S rRNA (cytosine(967)-C(5))-methyltransferase [Chromatiaceae bacterium]